MNNLTIQNLAKCYYISPSDSEDTAGFSPGEFLRGLRGRFTRGGTPAAPAVKEFWALRDVNLDVAPGTILGIIGANGAGKSTLLKVIARVTAPTQGRVVGVGRVVSLLELGAGFNEEASARENVLMNAALNGFSKSQALARFDEIIKFAEIGDLVDSPLKYYSSGMYLRLAFSVAVNMQPRILLADEILAVGDAAFQERCLERVAQMGRDGLTVLFVSHDMDAVMRVCNRVVWLDAGKLVKDGDPEDVVTEYQNTSWARADAAKSERGRTSNRWAEILSVRLLSAAGREVGAPSVDEEFFIRIRFRTNRGRLFVRAAADVRVRNQLVFRAVDDDFKELPVSDVYDATLRVPARFLSEITYTVGVTLVIQRDGKEYMLVDYKALTFLAYSSDESKLAKVYREGLLSPRLPWAVERAEKVEHAG